MYVGSVVWRTLVSSQRVRAFDVLQTPSSVGIGLLGALTVAGEGSSGSLALGAVGLIGAAASYAAVEILRRRSDARANVVFFSMLAVALLLIGSGAILSGPALVAWYGGLAVVAAVLGWRETEPQWSLQAAVVGFAMAIASGMLVWAAHVWFVLPARGCPSPPRRSRRLPLPRRAWPSRRRKWKPLPPACRCHSSQASPDSCWLSCFSVGGGGITVWWLGPFVAGRPIDAGVFASMTTVVLAGSAVAVAAVFRFTSWVEFRWLVYPVLVAGGLKLIADDFRHSTPSTLFAALAVYGVALILAPRILRRS